jgi:hypothetical protein
MPKRLKLEPHQTPSELSKLYPQASDPIERTRYQIIWLLATGRVTEDVADVTGYCRNSIYRLVRRYNQLGANGLKDKRHQHPETQPLPRKLGLKPRPSRTALSSTKCKKLLNIHTL